MNCEWCGSPYGVERANGTVTCPECRAGFEKPGYSLLIIEILIVAAVATFAYFFVWKWEP